MSLYIHFMELFFHFVQYRLVKHFRKWSSDRACSHTSLSPDTTSSSSERIPGCLQASRLTWSWTSSICVDSLSNSFINLALFNLRNTVQRSFHHSSLYSLSLKLRQTLRFTLTFSRQLQSASGPNLLSSLWPCYMTE